MPKNISFPQLFSSWESWSFSDSIYFSFITLSTIGFGDLSPTEVDQTNDTHFPEVIRKMNTIIFQSFAGATSGAKMSEFMKMIGATIYCSIGRNKIAPAFCFPSYFYIQTSILIVFLKYGNGFIGKKAKVDFIPDTMRTKKPFISPKI